MNWTTKYPTQPGYYWIRNWDTIEPQRSQPRIVEVTPELNFYQTGDEWVYDQRGAKDAEWCGPIQPLQENEND